MSPKSPLWNRIQSFELDDPSATLPFSARLAREQGWSRAYAHAAIEEYKRFLYLAATAPHPVTPSVAVDEVWHLHLVYTRSYWEELCGRVLGKPLHHEPTRGGPSEGRKYADLYARTLARHRETFGEAPPPSLWPPMEQRFAPPENALQGGQVRRPSAEAGGSGIGSCGVGYGVNRIGDPYADDGDGGDAGDGGDGGDGGCGSGCGGGCGGGCGS